MSWTYSGIPDSSLLDRYRFLLGDTCEEEPILQDEEVLFILSELSSASEDKIMIKLLETVILRFTKEATRKKLGPLSEEYTERLNNYNRQLRYYTRKSYSVGLSAPSYQGDKIFMKGMHSNV